MADEDGRERVMTVAGVHDVGRDAEATFFESARIYRLLHDNPAFDETLRALRAAAGSGARIRVRLATPHGDVIEAILPVR